MQFGALQSLEFSPEISGEQATPVRHYVLGAIKLEHEGCSYCLCCERV